MHTAGGSSGLVRSFRLALTIQGLRPSTIRHYTHDVETFLRRYPQLGPRSITKSHIRDFVLEFQATHAPKTVRELQLALRKFFRFLLDEGEITRDPAADMKLASYRVIPQPTYTEGEVRQLLMVCDQKTKQGVRDRAIIMTLYDTGLRAGELISMRSPDWERSAATVEGKTGVRRVHLGLATLQALDRYARRCRLTDGRFWFGKKGPLTESGVLQLIRRRCLEAGIQHKGVHAFRRAASAQMKRLGMNDSDILENMGWKSVEMLRRYTGMVAEELAHQAHERHSPGDALSLSCQPTNSRGV